MEGEGLTPLIPIFATAYDPKPAQSISQPHNVLSLTVLLFLASHFPSIGLWIYPFFLQPKFGLFKFPSPFVALIIQTICCKVSTLCIFLHSALMCFELHTYEVQTVPSRIVTVPFYTEHGPSSYQLMSCDFRV